MQDPVLVAASPDVVDAVRTALPEFEVRALPGSLREQSFQNPHCVFVGPETELAHENSIIHGRNVPVVRLVAQEGKLPITLDESDIPYAHVESESEIRLALRLALVQHRLAQVMGALNGPWSHDARGALGVVRLALELIRSSDDPTSSIQKIENGTTRLGWLIERLPTQIALGLGLPLPERPPATLFPSLQAYVAHLVLVHSRRPIEIAAEPWATTSASQLLVPFAAGFAELAFKVSPARAMVRFAASLEDGLEVECECPGRPEPWNVQSTLDASALVRFGDVLVPYRLIEAARLALRSKIRFSVAFTEKGFVGKAGPVEDA